MSNKTYKQMLQATSHADGKQWLQTLKQLHERQAQELQRYIEQFEVASANEMKADPDYKVPTTTNILSWAVNTLPYVPTNARLDLLPNITAAIVLSNARGE